MIDLIAFYEGFREAMPDGEAAIQYHGEPQIELCWTEGPPQIPMLRMDVVVLLKLIEGQERHAGRRVGQEVRLSAEKKKAELGTSDAPVVLLRRAAEKA